MVITPAAAVYPKKSERNQKRLLQSTISCWDTMTITKILPLGDQALLAYCDDEKAALRLATYVRQASWPWLVDVVQAYASVGIYFDLLQTTFAEVAAVVRLEPTDPVANETVAGKLHVVPCCYEVGLDLARVAEHTGLQAADIIRLHTATVYTVYAIGFCPGFPYLGYLPRELSGVPRLSTPRQRVEAGSVGLTGRQTGIYTEARPGGWNIVGRTPLQMVDVARGFFPLRTGDRVQFEAIDQARFRQLAQPR
jgi:inhibitor of KinA